MNKNELLERLKDIEWDDFEVKEARSELPKSVWETVSSFSNTLINPLGKKYNMDGKIVLAFFIPSSQQKPVYYNSLANTFIRSGSGDQRATDMEINALFRDQAFGVRSDLTVEGLGIGDLSTGSLTTYRNRVKHQNPQLPYNDLPDTEFCEKLGITKNGVLTYGGLLMLGNGDAVRRTLSSFWVDYLEIPGKFCVDISKLSKNAVSAPRNPAIARLFRWAKLAENAGFGVDKMLVWKHKVEFETFVEYSEVTYYLEENEVSDPNTTPNCAPISTPLLTEIEQSILNAISKNNTITKEELETTFNLGRTMIKRHIRNLKQKGVLVWEGNNWTGHWRLVEKQ